MVLSFKGRTCGCESLDLQRPTRDRDAHAADYSANERARNLSVIADKGQIPNDWWPHKMRVEYSTAYRPIVILQTKETKAVRINTFFSKRDAHSSPLFSQLSQIKFMDLTILSRFYTYLS